MSFSAVVVALLPVFLFYGTFGETDARLCSSSCGNRNISHPFRLKDDPDRCGDLRYNLSCENNQLILYWGRGKYHVQSINYNNFTIRLVDDNIRPYNYSFLPRYSLAPYNFSSQHDAYQTYQTSGYSPGLITTKLIIYLSCENPVDSSSYVDIAPCMSGSYASASSPSHQNRSFYLSVGSNSLSDLGLGDSCRIDLMYMTSIPAPNIHNNMSCRDIHDSLLYGFELSWLPSVCRNHARRHYYAYLDDHNKPQCEQLDLKLTAVYVILSFIAGLISGLFGIIFPSMRNLYPNRWPPYLLGEIISPFIAARILVGATLLVVLLIYQCRRRHASMFESIEDFLQHNQLMPIRYSYKEVKNMTIAFSHKLGEGGYGSVYKGKLRSGPYVAIKMLGKAKANGQEFINEVATIGRIHHVNVVRLIGYCVEGSKRALVYEFMHNGSLDKYIFSKEASIPLGVEKIYQIALGIAKGITYLHQGCDMQILHFDIKPHNILLDENFAPKVSDFGLAKLYPVNDSIVTLTAARGTIGYMAPELFYKNIGGVSYKADVYSFGMLLMEMTSKRKNLNPHAEQSSQLYFPLWIYDQFSKDKDIEMEDISEEEKILAKKMFIIALWCIQLRPDDRPSMSKVVEMLEGEVEELQMPPKPSLYPNEAAVDDEGINPGQTLSSDSIGSTSYPLLENDT